jgi:glycosyltransferase involved in cell wall biosynthesis
VRRQIKVATIITRLAAGAGGVALRGALALDPHEYEITIITGGAGIGSRAVPRQRGGDPVVTGIAAITGAPSGDLLHEAFTAGLPVARLGDLVPEISPRKDRAALHTLTSFLRDGDFDVVHTHSAKAGALGRIAASRAGVPRIVHTYHGFPFHDFQSAWRHAAYVKIEQRLGRNTDMFLAVGTNVAAEAIRRGIASPERVRTITPVIDTRDAHMGSAARGLARRRLGLPTGVRLMGTVGRIDYQKAPLDWIDALASIRGDDVWGLWIGDGPQRDQMLARARSLHVDHRLVLLGQRDDVRGLLPALDVFVMASRYEGLPCAVIEAMEAEVPVVATAVNSMPDMVVPGETGLLVPTGRPDLLGRAVAYMLDHPDDAGRMARNARVRVGDQFTPATLGVVLDRTYRGSTPWI